MTSRKKDPVGGARSYAFNEDNGDAKKTATLWLLARVLQQCCRSTLGATLKKMLIVYDFLLCAPFVPNKRNCGNSTLLCRERRLRNELSACRTCSMHCAVHCKWLAKTKPRKKQCEKSAVHFFVSYGRWFLKKMWKGVSMEELNKKVRFY